MADRNESSPTKAATTQDAQEKPKEEAKAMEPQTNEEKPEEQKLANTVEEEQKQEETEEEKNKEEERSIYIKNVDYNTESKELEAHFAQCGKIEKVTIVCDKYNGHPLGYTFFI